MIACHVSRAISRDHRTRYLACISSCSRRERSRNGKNYGAFSCRPTRSSRSLRSESFIHLGTDWYAPTDDQKVAWEIKTARQPVSLASVDFTGSSRASASRVLAIQEDVSVSTSLMQILRGTQNRFFPSDDPRQDAACRIIFARDSDVLNIFTAQDYKSQGRGNKKKSLLAYCATMFAFIRDNIPYNASTRYYHRPFRNRKLVKNCRTIKK